MLLVVEDDPAHVRLIERCLCPAGDEDVHLELRHVADGQQALDYLFRRGAFVDSDASPRPQLVLLDLRLPRCDGFEVLESVKGDARTQAIPVVVLTTSDAPRDISEAYARQANGYLVKPGDIEEMSDMLARARAFWLQHNRTVIDDEQIAS
ncbi:MAG: response regulator [Myxococcota bacterium]